MKEVCKVGGRDKLGLGIMRDGGVGFTIELEFKGLFALLYWKRIDFSVKVS